MALQNPGKREKGYTEPKGAGYHHPWDYETVFDTLLEYSKARIKLQTNTSLDFSVQKNLVECKCSHKQFVLFITLVIYGTSCLSKDTSYFSDILS